MRLNGLLKLKTGDFELELSPQAIAMRPKREAAKDDKPSEPEFTQEQVLFWSSPGINLSEEDNA